MINTTLSPNTQSDDALLALKLLFLPFNYNKGNNIPDINNLFENKHVSYTNAGRSAFLEILKHLDFEKKSEIIVQAYTCNALLNPILKSGLTPIYVDICDDLNIDPEKIKITEKTKAIVIQHTFGHPSKIKEIQKIAKENNLILIEDCAHSLGNKYEGEYLGNFGDYAFLSFGRDKIISSVYGGAIISKEKLNLNLKYPSYFWTFQQLLHPILFFFFIKPFYNLLLGKVIAKVFLSLNLISRSVYREENQGIFLDKYFPRKLPNALISLLNNQFKKLSVFSEHRIKIQEYYINNLKKEMVFTDNKHALMRFPILVDNPEPLLKHLKEKGIHLEDGWQKSVIVPPKTNLEKFYYRYDCKNAESISKRIINLPTHINTSMEDAKTLVDTLNKWN